MSTEDKKIIDDVLDTRRSFTVSANDAEYFIGAPTAEDIRNADWQYSKKYTKCLTEGLPTSAELSDILRRRGVIGEDFDRRVEELQTILHEKLMRLAEATENELKAALAYEVAQARESLFQWNQRLSGPMSNTCEQISDDARLEYLTASMLQNQDGSRVWETFDKFLAEQHRELALQARYEVMLYLQGYASDFLNNTPEALAMREVQDNILRELELEQVAQEEVKLVDVEEPKLIDEEVVQKITEPISTNKKPIKKTTAKAIDKKLAEDKLV